MKLFVLQKAHLITFIFSAVCVLVFQAYLVGFPTTEVPNELVWIGHHGWVHAENLALSGNADWKNLITYVAKIKTENGISYEYISRIPIVFHLFLKLLIFELPFSDDFKTFLASQFMNLALLLQMWLSYRILLYFNLSTNLSMASVFLAFSGYHMMFSRDMLEQYSTFGFLTILLVTHSIMYYINTRKKGYLYFSLTIGSFLGTTLIFVVMAWFFYNLILIFRRMKIRFTNMQYRKLKFILFYIFKQTSFKALSLSASLIFLWLAFSINAEANLIQKAWHETQIVESMTRALPIRSEKVIWPHKQSQQPMAWDNFFKNQIKRSEFAIFSIFSTNHLIQLKSLINNYWNVIFMVFFALFLYVFISLFKNLSRKAKEVLWVLSLSSISYICTLRRFITWHDYTTIIHTGLILLFLAFILNHLLSRYKFSHLFIVLLACFIFNKNNISINQYKSVLAERTNWQARDFIKIQKKIPKGSNIFYPEGHRNLLPLVPYVVGFYFREHWIVTEKEKADYIISNKQNYSINTLTPQNKGIFLFSNK